ncbi:MAG TPA: protein kinase [Thermoanaerobaculia bacterium]|nr:protein kinase [Thermoanaerobaculia bacterium]
MAAEAATPTNAPAPPAKRRRSLGLGTRIFLVIALVVALAIGAAVVFSFVVAERIARDTAGADLASTGQIQDTFRDQRYDQLLLSSYLFVQGDAYLSAYIAEAVSTNDTASILDLLSERQVDLGYDFAIVLDPQGRVLARTDRPGVVGEDLSARPLVDRVLTDYEAFGVWREGDDLYYSVAIPIARGAQLIGFLVSGFALSDDTAAEVKRVSRSEVAYVATGEGSPQVVASSLDGQVEGELVAALTAAGDPLGDMAAGSAGEHEVSLGGERWLVRVTPLVDAGREPVGAAVALAPLAPQLEPFRRIGRVLAITGLVALALALLLAFTLARRTLKPVRQLVAATAAARGGDYDRQIPVERGDEVGELADSFNALLSDLREKRDMETYIADLSRTMPEPVAPAEPVAPLAASGGEATFLVVDLRVGVAAAAGNPQVAFDRFSAELSRLAQLAVARRGKLAGLAGHRVWVRFEGDGRTYRAFACAGEMVRTYVDAGRTAAAPVVAIASGEAAWGAAAFGEERRGTTLGRTAQRLETLMREASAGDIAISSEAEAELRSTLAEAGVSIAEQRGMVSTQPLFVIDAATAAKLIGDQALPTLASTGPRTATRVGGGDTPVTFSSIGPGAVVGGRFEILSVIGAGGMGVVYKARDRELGDVVAVKMLRPDLAGDVTHVTRLRDELRLARRITHPNVLRTFDLGEVGGIPFISMEYVRGVTLAQLLDHTDRLAYSAGISVGKQLCQGLAAAHEVGVLHRDIKPANLILMPNGNLKLMDFGIARPIQRTEPGQTVEGWLVGTPKYLAPEQLRGEEPDARADIYACGVVLYEMFTGTAPFEGESYVELATKTLREDVPPPKQRWAEMPPELEAIIMKCLAKDPKERYASAEALLGDLSRLKA